MVKIELPSFILIKTLTLLCNKMNIKSFTFLITVFLIGCYDPPELSVEPAISFNKIIFVEVDGASDSLILTFNFQDGDGDIGLDANELAPPYHTFNYVVEQLPSSYNPIEFGQSQFLEPLQLAVIYNEEIILSGSYDASGGLPPYGCADYIIVMDEQASPGDSDQTDTLLIEKNIYNKNIYVDFYRKIRGEYQLINDDFSQGGCVEFFNSRIPIFDQENIGKSLKGDVSFAMLSQGFKQTFKNDSIKMSFYIYDRGLNKSNVAETPDFVLANITK